MTDKALEAALLPCPFCGGEAQTLEYNGTTQATCAARHTECAGTDITAPVGMWNRRAPLSALPGEAEVVGHRCSYEGLGWFVTDNAAVVSDCLSQKGTAIPLVTLASLQAMQARAEKAERERDAASREMRGLLNSFVREHFPDNTGFMPLDDLIGMITQMDNASTVARDYLSRAETAEARVKELEEERDALRSRIEEQRVNFAGSSQRMLTWT